MQGFFRRERQNAVFLVSLASLSEEIILRCDILNTRCASFKIKKHFPDCLIKKSSSFIHFTNFYEIEGLHDFQNRLGCDNIKSN